MKNRLRELLRRKKKSNIWLAERLGVHPVTISKLITGKLPMAPHWVEKIAKELNIEPIELLTDLSQTQHQPPAAESRFPVDVPVMGVAAGAGAAEGALLVDQSAPIAYVKRPPGLTQSRDIYALHVIGDSMEPRYFDGELVFVSPSKPHRRGDHVIILVSHFEGDIQRAYLKRFISATAQEIITEQYNPPGSEMRFSRRTVTAIHRVLTPNELFGI